MENLLYKIDYKSFKDIVYINWRGEIYKKFFKSQKDYNKFIKNLLYKTDVLLINKDLQDINTVFKNKSSKYQSYSMLKFIKYPAWNTDVKSYYYDEAYSLQ